MSKKYIINFCVPNCNYNIIDHPVNLFLRTIPKKDGKQIFHEWYLQYENNTLTCYIEKEVIEQVVEWIKDKIVTDPDWAQSLHRETEQINREYFFYAKEVLQMDLKSMSNEDLHEVYKKLRTLQMQGHSHACSTTWFVDSYSEVFSGHLRNELEKHLLTKGIDDHAKVVEYFTILTTPNRADGFMQEDQMDFLNLVKELQQDKQVVDIFKTTEVGGIFDLLPEDAKNKILAHHKKWHWTPYTYTGPAYDLKHYLTEIKNQIGFENIEEVIEEEETRAEKIKAEQADLIRNIELPEKLSRLFTIAQEIIWLKDFRKFCFYHGHFVLDKINKEVGRRLHLSLNQVNHLTNPEYPKALLDGEYDENLINQRIKFSLVWSDEDNVKYYVGNEAREIVDSFDIEEVEVNEEDGFRGTCAYPGEVEGLVKIVLDVGDIGKVEEGDIMLALTTHPGFLPAMKKAKAIVTEDGGITCHAAIVSREFKIPCVVGARKITKLLQDGDRVVVDATNGLVKKI